MFARNLVATLSLAVAGALAGCAEQPLEPATLPAATANEPAFAKGGRAGSMGVVFVTSQGLYYDTFVAVDPLPMKGRFQLIENGTTEFGPGDPGYLGGRWWEDLNGNGVQDADDHFFLCPLLGPGRESP